MASESEDWNRYAEALRDSCHNLIGEAQQNNKLAIQQCYAPGLYGFAQSYLDQQERIEQLEEKLTRAQAEIGALQYDLACREAEVARLEAENARLSERLPCGHYRRENEYEGGCALCVLQAHAQQLEADRDEYLEQWQAAQRCLAESDAEYWEMKAELTAEKDELEQSWDAMLEKALVVERVAHQVTIDTLTAENAELKAERDRLRGAAERLFNRFRIRNKREGQKWRLPVWVLSLDFDEETTTVVLALRDALATTAPAPEDAQVPQARLFPDDPDLDGTDGAHPAWWRGEKAGAEGACRRIREAMTGETAGSCVEPLQSLREAIAAREVVIQAALSWESGVQDADYRLREAIWALRAHDGQDQGGEINANG